MFTWPAPTVSPTLLHRMVKTLVAPVRQSRTGRRAALHKEHVDNEDECEQNRPGDCFVKVVGQSGHALTFDKYIFWQAFLTLTKRQRCTRNALTTKINASKIDPETVLLWW